MISSGIPTEICKRLYSLTLSNPCSVMCVMTEPLLMVDAWKKISL